MSQKALRLLPIHMGGTIASTRQNEGVAPGLSFEKLLDDALGEAGAKEIRKRFDLLPALAPFGPSGLDSSEIILAHIQTVAGAIIEHYDGCDAFLITHGTDTLAYTAAFLSMMLQGLNKPVVITGSQRALFEESSDAPLNLEDAFCVIRSGRPGVWVVFGGMVMAGSRATKLDTEADEGFVASDGSQESTERFIAYDIPDGFRQERFTTEASDAVELLFLSPGMTPHRLQKILEAMEGVKALIVLVYGMGGQRGELWDVLGAWKRRSGAAVVAKSQCAFGITDLSKYAVGRRAEAQGILSAKDMGLEALYAKLSLLAFRGEEAITRGLYQNIAGEMAEAVTP